LGKGPFRWVALSGKPEDIYVTDEAVLKTFPHDESLARWIKNARQKVKFQGYQLASAGLATGREPYLVM